MTTRGIAKAIARVMRRAWRQERVYRPKTSVSSRYRFLQQANSLGLTDSEWLALSLLLKDIVKKRPRTGDA